jgi:hypothetical protein
MSNSYFVFLISSAVAAVIYLVTWFALRARADKLIGGSAALAFLLSPWWAVLAGAIFGHAVAVILVRKLSNTDNTHNLPVVALAVLGSFIAGTMYNTNVVANQALALAKEGNSAAWQEFAERNEASRFVAETYRPCIEERKVTFNATDFKNSSAVCRGSVVAIASARGQEFARTVDEEILAWADITPITPAVQAKIDALLAAI